MKLRLLFILTLFNCCQVFGQCLPNGITTNPMNPTNPQLPSKTNFFFDWTQSSWQNNSFCQPFTQIESPFFKTDNLEILRSSKDMLPEDGWELIRRDFGYTDQNAIKPEVPEHTYFILYNKFTGVLRVLLKTCRGLDYNGVKITLKFDATTSFQTALLDFTSSIRALNETHIKNPSVQSASAFVNDQTKWFYADFLMAYDPCNCNYKSKINIISELIENSTITLQGSITGSITSITNGQGTVNNDGSYSFKDFVSDADKFKKGYASVDKFITETKNVANTIPNSQTATNISNGLTQLQTGLKNATFLKAGLAAVPWLQAASSLVDLFVGGGKTAPQQVQIMPMAANLSLKVSGTMSTSNQYHNIIFSNPGSLDAQNDPDIYPFYNETLGVFNLLTGPTFLNYIYTTREGSYREGFKTVLHQIRKLKEPIKWVINPASNLQLQDARVAFVVATGTSEASPPSVYKEGFNYLEGKNEETQTWQYRTDYVDINCLGLNDIFHFTQGDGNIHPKKFFMKFILNFKRLDNPNAQNILMVLTYPIRGEQSLDPLTGTDFSPVCVGGAISQATSNEIGSFCSNTVYTTNRAAAIQKNDNAPILDLPNSPSSTGDIIISPNPASHKVAFRSTNNKRMRMIEIYSAIGSSVHRKDVLNPSLLEELDVSNLSNGVYFAKVLYEDGQWETKRFTISK